MQVCEQDSSSPVFFAFQTQFSPQQPAHPSDFVAH